MLPDRDSRDRLVGAIGALLAGRITAEEFEGRVPARSSDPAIRAMLSDGTWKLFTGQPDHPLAYRDRAIVARWMVFLRTDKTYDWPLPTRRRQIANALAAVVTFGMAARRYRRQVAALGDLAVWPFLRRADYDAAMQSPNTL
jgi:hypothetical protein